MESVDGVIRSGIVRGSWGNFGIGEGIHDYEVGIVVRTG